VKTFNPGISGLARLDGLAALYDEYRIVSAKAVYKPYVGTTSAGQFIIAVDYDTVRTPTTLAALNPMQPQVRTPVWKEAAVTIDPKRANKQFWLRTANASVLETGSFALASAWTGTASCGEVWLEYTVVFTNPRSTYTPSLTFSAKGGVNAFGAPDTSPSGCGVALNPNAPVAGETIYPFFNVPGTFELFMTGNLAVDQTLANTIQAWWNALGWENDILYAAGAIYAFVRTKLNSPLIKDQSGVSPGYNIEFARMLLPGLALPDINNLGFLIRRLADGDWMGDLNPFGGAFGERQKREQLMENLSQPVLLGDTMVAVEAPAQGKPSVVRKQ
jgi:hypothetical protein